MRRSEQNQKVRQFLDLCVVALFVGRILCFFVWDEERSKTIKGEIKSRIGEESLEVNSVQGSPILVVFSSWTRAESWRK